MANPQFVIKYKNQYVGSLYSYLVDSIFDAARYNSVGRAKGTITSMKNNAVRFSNGRMTYGNDFQIVEIEVAEKQTVWQDF